MVQLHHLLSLQSLACHSFAGLPMSLTHEMLVSIADSVNFLIVLSRIIGASCPLRLCCCADVDGLLWTAVLYSTNTLTDSMALTAVRCRSFWVVMLGFDSSLPKYNKNQYQRFFMRPFQSLFFDIQIMMVFRAPISSLFIKSLMRHLQVRLTQEYSLSILSVLSPPAFSAVVLNYHVDFHVTFVGYWMESTLVFLCS